MNNQENLIKKCIENLRQENIGTYKTVIHSGNCFELILANKENVVIYHESYRVNTVSTSNTLIKCLLIGIEINLNPIIGQGHCLTCNSTFTLYKNDNNGLFECKNCLSDRHNQEHRQDIENYLNIKFMEA